MQHSRLFVIVFRMRNATESVQTSSCRFLLFAVLMLINFDVTLTEKSYPDVSK